MAAEAHEPTHSSSELLVGADWAFSHNDMDALAHTIRRLAARSSTSLRADLLGFAELCGRDGTLAARRWPMLRGELCSELKTAIANAGPG